MRTILSRTPQESSFSFSRRHFHWIISKVEFAAGSKANATDTAEDAGFPRIQIATAPNPAQPLRSARNRTPPRGPVARLRSVLTYAISGRTSGPAGLGSRLIGTLYGSRRGHVRFAFQADPRASPALLVELAMPTTSLVKEMASGLVRIALECERKGGFAAAGVKPRLLEERLWRSYCNGKKCGFAAQRECGAADWRVLRAVEMVSMGAGVLPPEKEGVAGGGGGGKGEVMYMRARFERVVGSRDSEAFYMMNPDGGGGPELSIYLLRVN
ncbi:hypothetical protein HPP92_024701 [Vanilla planifolia]|uniref:Protein MIZU-KUSSEI 1 n=1 Tax=Vanilla planifolia TaxID=51239 RepID=A0A835UA61_VANPL|nr:hypothetical protein HPP92_024701 [Vanilla planifolia]